MPAKVMLHTHDLTDLSLYTPTKEMVLSTVQIDPEIWLTSPEAMLLGFQSRRHLSTKPCSLHCTVLFCFPGNSAEFCRPLL
jgi:hypothetical protein